MNFTFNEEQNMMRRMVRDFAKNEVGPFTPRMEAGEFPRPLLEKMG
ncbi:MAG: acyl-CoA dehydrogenase family protein, partial [Bhargavaea sp.]